MATQARAAAYENEAGRQMQALGLSGDIASRLAGLDMDKARARLAAEALRLDALAAAAGWREAGGTDLFRLYETPDAAAAQAGLARGRVWSRIFPWSPRLLRLGLPGTPAEWEQLALAFAGTEARA